MADTEEELVGFDLVLRRPTAITWRALRLAAIAVVVWVLTVSLTALGTRSGGSRWWLLPALLGATVAAGCSVLAVRVVSSRIVLSRQSVSVASLAGRRSTPWAKVGGVEAARPYFGLLGDMPVLTLTDQRLLSVDALARRENLVAVGEDVARIRTYLGLPGLPAAAAVAPALAPAGPSPAGKLRVSWGRLNALPNDVAAAARIVAARAVVPGVGITGGVMALLLATPPGPVHRFWAPVVLLVAVAVAAALNALACRGGVLTPLAYRNPSLLYRVDVAWPGTTVEVVPAVNAWGTRRIGHVRLIPGAPPAPPVELWETVRLRDEAEALARVMSTY